MGGKKGSHKGRLHQQLKLERAFDRADREDALRKQDGCCKYCEKPLTLKQVTRDHVIPRSAGGLNHRDNTVASCSPCNVAKGSLPVSQFMRLIRNPQPGDPMKYRLIWFDWRLNRALKQMRSNVFRAVGKKL